MKTALVFRNICPPMLGIAGPARVAATLLALALAACQGNPQPPASTIALDADSAVLHSGDSTAVTASVRQQPPGAPAPSPAPPSNVSFTANHAPSSLSPSSVASDIQGSAASTFTAGPVTMDTPVTVTAKYGSTLGTTVITVRPPRVVAVFPSGSAGDDAPIRPSVTTLSDGKLQYAYEITPGSRAGRLMAFNIDFTKPMVVSGPAGSTVVPLGGQPALRWVVRAPAPASAPAGWSTAVTVVAVGDANPGGTTTWDIVDNAGGRARITSTGPL